MKPNKTEVGLRIKGIRKNLGYSMDEFGKIVSESPRSSVNSWEKGVSIPRKEKLEKIAFLGNTTPQQILYGDFENYAHDLIDSKLKNRVPKELEYTMIQAIKKLNIEIGDDMQALKMMNYLIENMEPADENDYFEYSVLNELENLFIAYGDRGEVAKAFVYVDREKQVVHFSPPTFSNMSLSRIYIFLTNQELHHYILNDLSDFNIGEHPSFVIYDVENTENKIRVAHFKYNKKVKNYEPVLDSDLIKKMGVYSPFIIELVKELSFRTKEVKKNV